MKLPDSLPVPDNRTFWTVLDSTKLQCYARCQRKFFYEYVLGWTSDAVSNHLVFGKAWHEALEHLYQNNLKTTAVADAYNKFMCVYREELPETTDSYFKGKTPKIIPTALIEYCQLHAADVYKWKILATEIGGQVPISDSRYIALRIDMIVQDSAGLISAVEHKTGSQAGKTWDMQWATSLQIGTYLHALSCSFVESPEKAKVCIDGTFFYAKERKNTRIWARRAGWAMLDWLNTVNSLYTRIEEDFKALQNCDEYDTALYAFAKNPVSCTDYGGCPYFDLCVCIPNPLTYALNPPTGYKYRWWNPLEDVKRPLEVKNGK